MGDKNFRVGIFMELKLVRVGLQETNNFFFRLYLLLPSLDQWPVTHSFV